MNKLIHKRLLILLIGCVLLFAFVFTSCVSGPDGGETTDISSDGTITEDATTSPTATDDVTTEGATSSPATEESTEEITDVPTSEITTEVMTEKDTEAPTTAPETTKTPETTEAVTTEKVTEPPATEQPVTDPPVTEAPEPLETLIYNGDKTSTGSPADEVRLSFVAAGDNLIHSSILNQAKKSDGTYDFTDKYAGIADIIANADISFINQETPICPGYEPSAYPSFNSPKELGYNLVDLGFDVLCFANNHVADKGMAGIGAMLPYLDTLDVLSIGIYEDPDDYDTIRIYETQGVKIAFLAYTYGTNKYGQRTQYGSYSYCIPVYNEEVATKQIKFAREVADIVIVSMHWGTENTHNVNQTQADAAVLMAELGVDVILGTHPHVVQHIDILKSSTGHETVIYYSLGNSINSQMPVANVFGIMATFDIVKDKDGARIENVSLIPIISQQERGYKNVRLIKFTDFTDALAAAHNANYTDPNGRKMTVETVRRILLDVFNEEFLPLYITDPEAYATSTPETETNSPETETDPPVTETTAPITDSTSSSETEPESPRLTVCIDAGHQKGGISEKEPNGPGSTDMKAKLSSGTQGVSTRIPEYQLNLDVSLMLKEELIKRGYDVIMIRETNDCPKSNAERAIIANESGADIFVRIHANGSSNPDVKGALCCAPTVNNPYLTDENIAASRKLSQIVVDNLCRETGANNRGLYNVDTMTGINWCEIPVTIVEMGYMSNVEEDELMATEEYRLKIVDGIADGIDAYFAD